MIKKLKFNKTKSLNCKTMRKLVFTLLMLLTLSLNAQDGIIKFKGIPVDGHFPYTHCASCLPTNLGKKSESAMSCISFTVIPSSDVFCVTANCWMSLSLMLQDMVLFISGFIVIQRKASAMSVYQAKIG